MRTAAKFPTHIPLRKGKVKIPRDSDAAKSALQTTLLPDGIVFEGSPMGCVPIMKFEDWDLANSEKFPLLEIENLMKQSTEESVTNTRAVEMVALCGEGKTTSFNMDSTLSPHTYHNFHHQVAAFHGA